MLPFNAPRWCASLKSQRGHVSCLWLKEGSVPKFREHASILVTMLILCLKTIFFHWVLTHIDRRKVWLWSHPVIANIWCHHHHHIVLAARISLTLSRHSSLSFIALGRSSGQHPVSSHSCWMYVRAGRPAFARPCVGIHKSTSLMSSSLLLQQCPACLVRLTWIDFVIGGRWPYSWCLVGCRCQDLLRIARSILV